MANGSEVTRYNAEALVEARKVASAPKVNTLGQTNSLLTERCLRADLRRVSAPAVGISLELYSRVMIRGLPGVRTEQLPSASLMWHGKRIRGLDYSIKHDVVENGLIVDSIKGWHEHYWTDQDEDKRIRVPSPPLQNFDIQAIVAWVCRYWKIEGLTEQLGLFK